MKYAVTLFSLLFTMGLSAQQLWFDCGVKAQFGGTGLVNQAISDSGSWNYDIATGLGFGGKLGINFEVHGITIDALFGNASSSFEADGGSSNLNVDWQYTDIYMLYRLSRYRGYFEIGPKMTMLREVENNKTNTAESNIVTDKYESNGFSGVLGFGTYLIGSDGRFSGIFGLRFEYGFSDLVMQSFGESEGLPVDTPNIYDNGYQKSVPLFAGLVFEFNWGIGYYGKASCGQRGKFIFL